MRVCKQRLRVSRETKKDCISVRGACRVIVNEPRVYWAEQIASKQGIMLCGDAHVLLL